MSDVASPAPGTHVVHRSLTISYLVALALVAWAMVGSVLVMRAEAHIDRGAAEYVNESGRQRVRSQQLALLAWEATDPDVREVSLARMAATRQDLVSRHRQLVAFHEADASYAAVQALYDGPDGIDARLTRFLAAADAVAEDLGRGVVDTGAVAALSGQARDEMLPALETAVSTFAEANVAGAEVSHRTQQVLLALGLLVVVLTAAFVYRPMARRVHASVQDLEEANEELRQVAARASHDLRSPVASARGLVSMAQWELDRGGIEPAKQALAHVTDSIDRLEGVLDSIVSVLRVGRLKDGPESVDVARLVQDSLQALEALPGYDQLDIDVRCDVSGPVVVPRLPLAQAVDNLLSNAVKYADPGETSPRVVVHAASDGARCRVEVEDNGLGIPPDKRAQVFGMFQRFHPSSAAGSGLGLYLVRKSAAVLGGTVTYDPLPKGSRFTLEFPLQRSA